LLSHYADAASYGCRHDDAGYMLLAAAIASADAIVDTPLTLLPLSLPYMRHASYGARMQRNAITRYYIAIDAAALRLLAAFR